MHNALVDNIIYGELCVALIALQEGLSKVHFTADRSSHASALYSAEEQAKQAKKKVKTLSNSFHAVVSLY